MRRYNKQKNSSFSSNYRMRPGNSPPYLKLNQFPVQKSHSKNSFSSNLLSIHQDSVFKAQKCEISDSSKLKFPFPSSLIKEKSHCIFKNNSISPLHLKLPILSIFNKKHQISPNEKIMLSSRRNNSVSTIEDKMNMCTIGTSTNEDTEPKEFLDKISLRSKGNIQKKILLRCKDLTSILDPSPHPLSPDFHSPFENLYAKRIRLIKDLKKKDFQL